jgi:ribosome assembly protein 1
VLYHKIDKGRTKLFSFENTILLYRPLTAEDFAQRRELLKQKQIDKTTINEESANQTGENDQTTTDNGVVNSTKIESNETIDENVFLAFARVFSGRLKRGQKIFVLSPRHDPTLFVGKVRLIVPIQFRFFWF